MTSPGQDSHSSSLWRFIPLQEFSAPSEPPSEAFRLNLRAFWQRIRRDIRRDASVEIAVPDIRSAPQSVLDWLVPTPDWTKDLAQALSTALGEPPAPREARGTCRVVIAPPHTLVQDAVVQWSQEQGHHIVEPPTAQAILDDPHSWIRAWPAADDRVVVLPHLDRCVMRHPNGLTIVRWLADHLWHTDQRCVLACDSWAWAFLVHAARYDLVQPNPLTLAPLGAEELEQWIAGSVYGRNLTHVTFRRADNGRLAIRRPDAPEDGDFSREFLVHLAAYSRGNPGVAWDIWRRSLAIAVDEDVKAEAQAEAQKDTGRTIWVRPWEKVRRPSINAPTQDETYFVLHTLLLHPGANSMLLDRMLAASQVQAEPQLQMLRLAEILQVHDEQWWTAPSAYPSVRALLSQEGFLTDGL